MDEARKSSSNDEVEPMTSSNIDVVFIRVSAAANGWWPAEIPLRIRRGRTIDLCGRSILYSDCTLALYNILHTNMRNR
jgi:hypothetical protein